ncbi:MAG: Hsp70 family protein, partial [Verrucomicrobiota bacterium]|nr:Hsp70 family protein [Verrucomicrobiota bacterium]
PLLPWMASVEIPKISPLEASQRYLEHLHQSWNHQFPAKPLNQQEVVITVPASFDAAARDLTLQAARQAGLPNVTLLEEPQAALYAWIESTSEQFRKHLKVGDIILVVDVGGGTTDLSLIAVTEREGNLELTRLAVGDHILLGGDNMDLALSHTLNQRLATQGKKLDQWQLNSLTFGCREAKESLFNNPALDKTSITVPSRGSALVGGTIRVELSRTDLESLLTNGFFPKVAATDLPQATRRTGLTQMALPYAQDPAVTRHIAAFLSRQISALRNSPQSSVPVAGEKFLHPTAILFNGGVFKAAALRQRVLETLNEWLALEQSPSLRELPGVEFDLAVARGAAYYGWVRQGRGIRIRGGTARAYYVGIESAMPAVPGFEPPVKALCLAPFGMEEGTAAEIPPQEFGLIVGESADFRFFASSTRRGDKAGDLLEDATGNDELEELAPIQATLPPGRHNSGTIIPVNLQAAVTELGMLELRCIERDGAGQWKLELNVRMKT